jgi:hypothetical protein
MNEFAKRELVGDPATAQARHGHVGHFARLFASGVCSGTIVSFVSTPSFVLKIQLQTMKLKGGRSNPANSTLSTAKRIYEGGGIRAFYRGAPIQVINRCPLL